ncbi:MAG: DNA-processing protein DprA [Candidatus Omnitrophica bacterium]|nr:DNA-processing protein DprA [Candidatus Omnitrophota bacterium]
MTELEAYISLNSINIGSRKLNRLLEACGAPADILRSSCDKLQQIESIGDKLARQIAGLRHKDLAPEFELIKKFKLDLLTLQDETYPENLKKIYDPPILLYVKGKIDKMDNYSVAIVGSRRASFYGLSCAERFAFELGSSGLTIVSGMARGVDTAAHKGALRSKARTIAVIGSGFGHIYPDENKELAEEIARGGAVISEFPVDTSPLPQNFPRRNRVISGLSLAVLVAEAARNSGALITADFALEQGREVFALPGRVDCDNAFGSNGLIKQGAKLISCVEDILVELQLPLSEAVTRKDTQNSSAMEKKNLSNDEAIVYNLLSHKPLSQDEALERSGLILPEFMRAILGLEIKRAIVQLPGRQFIRNNA